MADKGKKTLPAGGSAFRVWERRLFPLSGRTFLFSLLRLPPLLCAFLALREEAILFAPWVWGAACVLLYGLLVIPARGYYRRALAGELGASQSGGGYARFLRLGLLRYLRGLLWGLPFLCGIGLFLYRMEFVRFTEQGLLFEAIARFFGFQQGEGLIIKGVALYFALLVPFFVLFLWGWRRDLPVDILMACSDENTVFAESKKVRQAGASALRRCALGNLLLYLPGLAFSVAAMIPYVLGNIRMSGNIAVMWHSLKKLMDRMPPTKTLLLLAAALLLVSLPLCVLRRLRSIDAVSGLARTKQTGGGHAAG